MESGPPPPETGAPMRPNGNSVPQAGCIQPAFVRDQPGHPQHRPITCPVGHNTANPMSPARTVMRWCLGTRPPVGEEGEEVGGADASISIEVLWTGQILLASLRSHRTENPAPLAVQPKENRPPLDGR